MHMKTRNKILALLSTALLWGCSYLDFDETNGLLTKEDAYKYFNNATSMLNYVYTFMPQDFGTIGNAMRDCATDDAEFANTYANIQDFNNGAWSALNPLDDQWSSFYTGIRSANNFIQDIKQVDFSDYLYAEKYNIWMQELPYYVYEARLLRAFYFFELARRYGDIPMPLTALSVEEANTIGKTKFGDVIAFVVSECEETALHLPVSYANIGDKQVGRMTKGFAMAVKAKALLYAASRLHNESMDVEKWKAAAKASLELIDSAEIRGWYELEGVFTALNNYEGKDVVMFRQNGNNSNFEKINFPVRFTHGQTTTTGVCPSQNLVDAFETLQGYSVRLEDNGWVSEDPAFDPAQPYQGRDPRFEKTILADGMDFKGEVIQTYKGGQDGIAVAQGGTPTGYFLRKYIQETTDFDPNKQVTNKHTWIVYRYAEALLSYAEVMTEAFGSPDYTDATYTRSARWALNQVRTNAGMPEITVTGKDEFLAKVRNEWRVEFAFEDHRFWDIRRWKIGADTQTALYGVSIEKQADDSRQYYRKLYETRSWSERMYLYPISQSELFKNSNLFPQNTGW